MESESKRVIDEIVCLPKNKSGKQISENKVNYYFSFQSTNIRFSLTHISKSPNIEKLKKKKPSSEHDFHPNKHNIMLFQII